MSNDGGIERQKALRHKGVRNREKNHLRVAQGRKGGGAVVALSEIPINRHMDPSSARSSSAASLLKYRGLWAVMVLYGDFGLLVRRNYFFNGDFGLLFVWAKQKSYIFGAIIDAKIVE